jgi:RimJ/RimL family protein N-acetyltransferase
MIPPPTERLHFAPLTLADAAFALELLNEPGYHRFIADRGIGTIEGASDYLLNGPLASYAKHHRGLLRVSLRATGEAIGMCGLLHRDIWPDPDIGFAFLERHNGRGYATEAAQAVMAHGRDVLGLTRMVGFTAPDNAASQRILGKLGLVRDRLVQLPGYPTVSVLFVPGPGEAAG